MFSAYSLEVNFLSTYIFKDLNIHAALSILRVLFVNIWFIVNT